MFAKNECYLYNKHFKYEFLKLLFEFISNDIDRAVNLAQPIGLALTRVGWGQKNP